MAITLDGTDGINASGNITAGNLISSGLGNVNSLDITGYGTVINSSGAWVGDNTGLQGPTGAQGTQGVTGTQGIQGIQGIQGVQGTTGTQGIQGIQGVQGIQGPVGPSTSINATDTNTNSEFEVVFVADLGSNQTASGSTGLTYNPSTDTLTAPNFIGDGSQLTGIDTAAIANGTSELRVIASGGNIRGNVSGSTVSLLSSGGLDVTGEITATGNITGGNIITSGSNGNIGGANVISAQKFSVTSQYDLPTADGTNGFVLATNGSGTVSFTDPTTVSGLQGIQGIQGIQGVQGTQGTTGTQGVTGAQGTTGTQGITGTQGATGPGTAINATDTNTNANFELVFVSALGSSQTANGSTDLYYNPSTNTLNAPNTTTLASSAKYADLAEKYIADENYSPGTVVVFGGAFEVTTTSEQADRKVAGVVSTDPAFLMNSDLNEENTLSIALTGRVPCKVMGPVSKGDILVTSKTSGYALVDNEPLPGTMIGKSLENNEHDGPHMIEIAVGRT